MGEFAAIGAALAFGFASTLFSLSGRTYGPLLVMQGSVPIGLLCIAILNLLTSGYLLPHDTPLATWVWLSLSGANGFWLASICLLNAFKRIGPRLALLIGAVNPILSAVLAWIFLDQSLQAIAIVGILLTIVGISIVVTEGNIIRDGIDPKEFRLGIIFALIAASLQAGSFVFSTLGLAAIVDPLPANLATLSPTFSHIHALIPLSLNPLSASLIRLASATIVLWLLALFQGQLRENLTTLIRFPVALRYLMGAAVMGTVVGALLVLIALQNAPVGIATTLINLTPIFLIPIGYVIFKERISSRAVVGTLVAMAGIAIIFV
ncbi:MAG: DMT family transporter [Aggregatilineales bacterium]